MNMIDAMVKRALELAENQDMPEILFRDFPEATEQQFEEVGRRLLRKSERDTRDGKLLLQLAEMMDDPLEALARKIANADFSELSADQVNEEMDAMLVGVDQRDIDTVVLRAAEIAREQAAALVKAADEARRRARGNDSAFLHDLMDDPVPVPGKPDREQDR